MPINISILSPMAPSADPLPRSWVAPSPPTQQTAAAADHNLVQRWTVPLGSIAGIPIRLHGEETPGRHLCSLLSLNPGEPAWALQRSSWAVTPAVRAVLFLVAVFLGVLNSSTDYWQNMVWAVILYGPILLVTVLLHELGHCLASRWVSCCKASLHSICVSSINLNSRCLLPGRS